MKNKQIKIIKEDKNWTEAYPVLSKVINEHKLQTGIEIGVAYGGHAEYILKNTQLKKLYGVDPYKHIWGYRDPMNFYFWKFNRIYESMLCRLSIFKDRFVIIRKKSKDALDDINGLVDFVYIDADHSYDGVKSDIERWFNKVRIGGFISGHDYGHPNFPGVKIAIDEFFKKYNWKVNYDKSGVWWVQKKNTPISFIIPAYNCEGTIRESVNSIIDTNFESDDEIIIVDDKSTDNTLGILKGISSSNSSIKIIENENNLGGGSTRNTAVKNSKNDLIFCLDSDNILEKNSISILREKLIQTDSDVVSFGEIHFFDEDTDKITHKWKYKNKTTEISDFFNSSHIPPSSGNYLFKKESWLKSGGYPEFAGALDTWGFGFRQIANYARMIIVPDTYYFHRHGHQSYWIRESQNGQMSNVANQIIKQYEDQINPKILKFIKNNPYEWFNLISIRYNTKSIIKKIFPYYLIRIIKYTYMYINFISDFLKFKNKSKIETRFTLKWKDKYPQLFDKTNYTDFDTHYIYHPAWAARKISEIKPSKHIDISSILSFATMLSAFVPVEFYDYRPANIKLSNLTSKKADLMSLPFENNRVESISCMHTIEHVGLGRYGDPIDPDGDIKAMKELSRVLAINGTLLFVTPIGKPRIQFNAHRIYSYDQIISYFPDLTLKEFSLLTDDGLQEGITYNASKELADKQTYGCGLFWFTKK